MYQPFRLGHKRPYRDTIFLLWVGCAIGLGWVAYSRYGSNLPDGISSHINFGPSAHNPTSNRPNQDTDKAPAHPNQPPSAEAESSWWEGLASAGQDGTDIPKEPLIPRKIWQNMFSHLIKPDELKDTPSWLALNPDYAYKLVGLPGADEILNKYYSDRNDIRDAFHRLRNTGLKSDILRYMLLFNEGGVYTDIDTSAIKPASKWVPEAYRDQIRLIVGLEFDQLDGVGWVDIPHVLQFCQWTIAAAPGHRVIHHMIEHSISRLQEILAEHSTTFEDLHPTSMDVLTSTGPAAWTDVVFAELQEIEPSLISLRNLSGMTKPRIFGDIMVLPIDAFGMGQPHSNSTNDGTIPKQALAKHHFRGSWRQKPPSEVEDDEPPADVQNSKGENIEQKPKDTPDREGRRPEDRPKEEKPKEEKPKEEKPEEEKPKGEKHNEEKPKEKPKEEKPQEKTPKGNRRRRSQ